MIRIAGGETVPEKKVLLSLREAQLHLIAALRISGVVVPPAALHGMRIIDKYTAHTCIYTHTQNGHAASTDLELTIFLSSLSKACYPYCIHTV